MSGQQGRMRYKTMNAKQYLNEALGGNMNTCSLKPLAIEELMEAYARKVMKNAAAPVESQSAGSLSGVLAYQPRYNDKDDLFEFDEEHRFGFPCAVCIHRHREASECRKCAHYAI